MPQPKSISCSFRVSYCPNVSHIKLFFKFSQSGYRFFFRVCLPPSESKDVSKKKLKLAAKTTCLSDKSIVVSNVPPRRRRVDTCSISV